MALVPITKDLNNKKIFEILKLNIPVVIYFTNIENEEVIENRISILERVFDSSKGINLPIVTLGKSKSKMKHNYNGIVELINIGLKQNLKYTILCESKYLVTHKPLIDMIGKFSDSLINTVTFIDYNKADKYYEIRNAPLDNGASDVLYYFENNNSVLMFNSDGPQLFIPEGISNISDILS